METNIDYFNHSLVGIFGVIFILIGLFNSSLKGRLGTIASVAMIILGSIFLGNVFSELVVLNGASYMTVQSPRMPGYDPVKFNDYILTLLFIAVVLTLLGVVSRLIILERRVQRKK